MSVFVTSIYVVNKNQDQSVADNTTLQNDSELFDPVYNGRKYAFKLFVPFNLAGILSGAKFAMSFPAGSTARWAGKVLNLTTDVFAFTALNNATGIVTGGLGTTGDHLFEAEGFFIAGSNGNLQFQFAQNVSNGNPITVLTGSRLEYFDLVV